MDVDCQDACWVCLGDASPSDPLTLPCACPRPVHAQCLARWQLHSAGTAEETACRFCEGGLPDWKAVLTPAAAAAAAAAGACPAPTMSVTFNGVVHHVVVRGGPGGYDAFLTDVRAIFGIDGGADVHLAFDCADPVTGALVKLNGAGAYQAAVHCASVSAAKRAAALADGEAAAAGAPPPAAAAAPQTPAPTPTPAALDRREAGGSADSEASSLDDAIAAALAAAAAPPPPAEADAAAPRAASPRPSSSHPPRRSSRRRRSSPATHDVRRALGAMAASLRRLQSGGGGGGGGAGVDPAALRALEARVAQMLAQLPQPARRGAAAE